LAGETDRRKKVEIMAIKRKNDACLIVKVEFPSGCDRPWIFAELGARTSDYSDTPDPIWPRTPEIVNDIFARDLNLVSIVHGATVPHGDVEYRHTSYVDEYKCERMMKTLRTVNARLRKLSGQLGHAQTWAESTMRFANATLCKEIAIERKTLRAWAPHGADSFRGDGYEFIQLSQARGWLERIADSLFAKYSDAPKLSVVESA
jgi:hypothetical protein